MPQTLLLAVLYVALVRVVQQNTMSEVTAILKVVFRFSKTTSCILVRYDTRKKTHYGTVLLRTLNAMTLLAVALTYER